MKFISNQYSILLVSMIWLLSTEKLILNTQNLCRLSENSIDIKKIILVNPKAVFDPSKNYIFKCKTLYSHFISSYVFFPAIPTGFFFFFIYMYELSQTNMPNLALCLTGDIKWNNKFLTVFSFPLSLSRINRLYNNLI